MSALDVVFEAVPSVSALGTHVWQSTLFVAACWFATLLLKHNSASLRYLIWLVASLKFLFPLSILVGIGGYAATLTGIQVVPEKWSVQSTVRALPEARQPFPQQSYPGRSDESHAVQAILVGGWLSGIAGIAVWGAVRWRRLTARIGKADLLGEGRELEALRMVQFQFGWTERVRLALSPSTIEPGLRGIVRPLLLLPAGIADRLSQDQLEAIIAHELCHLRRRDNLASAFHLIVQTIFWFHPFVWWIGSHLVDERERSCDEQVLKMGSDPQVYAGAILRVCEFYLAQPLATVSRVTGSNLTKRIEDIMIPRIVRQMGYGAKFLLASIAAAFVVTPILFGMATAPAVVSRPIVWSTPVPGESATVTLGPFELPVSPPPVSQVRPPAPPATIPAAVQKSAVENAPVVPASREDYRLQAGDELDVLVWKEPELRGRSLVRPDGKIGVPLVGDVPAEGLTPVQIQDAIRNELRHFISDPHVTVIVATARKPQVTIQGAVVRPGAYTLDGRLTVLKLIAQAGGLSAFATKPDQISIFREEGGAVRRILFDYGAFVAGANLEQNIALKEDDIVIVP